MRLIVAGGRDYRLSEADRERLDALVDAEGVETVICGGAPGVDTDAAVWARIEGLRVDVVPANWDKFGNAAGPIRNRKMAGMADAVVLFPGGRGTESMHGEAVKAGLKVFDWREQNDGY